MVEQNINISFLVLAYNQESTIIQTIDSIVCQGLSKYEIIICDDCSKDKTVDIIKNWIAEKENLLPITIISQPQNLGITKNFISGIHQSKGEYIKVIAGDDWFVEGAVKPILNELLKKQHTLYICNLINYYENNQTYGLQDKLYFPYFSNLSATQQFNELLDTNKVGAPAVFIKREVLVQMLHCLESYTMLEDYPLWLEFTNSGHKFEYIDIDCVYYRHSNSNISSKNKSILLASTVQKIYYKDFFRFKKSIPTRYFLSFSQKIVVDKSIVENLYEKGIISKLNYVLRLYFLKSSKNIYKICRHIIK